MNLVQEIIGIIVKSSVKDELRFDKSIWTTTTHQILPVEKDKRNNLENLIGSIPFLLQDRQIFKTNLDIAEFAAKLDIELSSPEKKKREEIIGRIVAAIIDFDENRVAELKMIIDSFKTETTKNRKRNADKTSFFLDWDAAIKQMKVH